MHKHFFGLILGFLGLLMLSDQVRANEGTVDLVGNNVECLATSVEVTPKKYDILLRCKNVVYPPGTGNLYYLWAEGENSKITRLGDIELGKAKFSANTPFNKLFVTIEQKKNPMSNSGIVVMRGDLTSFVFSNITEAEPTTIKPLEEEKVTTDEEVQKIEEEAQKSDQTSILTRITSFLLRAGVIILIVVAVVGVIMFVISKIR